MSRSRIPAWQLTVGMIGLFALIMAGFAHKPVDLADSQDADLAGYVLPDGTLPVLCLTGDNDSGSGQRAHQDACDFCRLASSVVLPAPDHFDRAARIGISQPLLPEQADPLLARKADLLPPVRGPPSIAA